MIWVSLSIPSEFQAGIVGGLGRAALSSWHAAAVCFLNLVEWFSPGSDLLLQSSKKKRSPALTCQSVTFSCAVSGQELEA